MNISRNHQAKTSIEKVKTPTNIFKMYFLGVFTLSIVNLLLKSLSGFDKHKIFLGTRPAIEKSIFLKYSKIPVWGRREKNGVEVCRILVRLYA